MILLLLLLAQDAYHDVSIPNFSTKPHTHVCTTGDVTLVKKEADGDIHIRVNETKTSPAFIVAEIIPKLPVSKPKVGDHVKVCGIRRFDDTHGWWELHPVLSITHGEK